MKTVIKKRGNGAAVSIPAARQRSVVMARHRPAKLAALIGIETF